MSASHCPLGLQTLKFHYMNHLVDDFGRSAIMSTIDVELFERVGVLSRQSYTISSLYLFTRKDEIVQSMGSALHGVQSAKDGAYRSRDGAAVLNTR